MTLPQLEPLYMTIRAGDGLLLRGVLRYPVAQGQDGPFPLAVLAHQYPGTRDCYAPLVADLLAAGIATLAFDQRGHGESVHGPEGTRVISTPSDFTLASAVMAFSSSANEVGFDRIPDDVCRVANWGVMQNHIAPKVLLVGSSVGGSGVILAAESIPLLSAVVTLGAAGAPAFGSDGPHRIRRAMERIAVPCYLASSHDDVFDGASNVINWGRGLSNVSTRLVDGEAHAMGIYYQVRDELLSFVKAAVTA